MLLLKRGFKWTFNNQQFVSSNSSMKYADSSPLFFVENMHSEASS